MSCADCGAKLYNHRMPYPTTYKNKKGYLCNRPPKDVYACSTYSLTGRKFDRKCTNHQIRTVVLRELALESIKAVSEYVNEREEDFIRQVRETSAIRQVETARTHRRRMDKEQKRAAELDTLIKRLYEDYVGGRLTGKRFELLSQEYEQEQTELDISISRLQAELDDFAADGKKAERFIAIVKRHTDFSELTGQMIAEYIDKIIVHEADWSSGERHQQVDIHLNFIGKFDVPTAEPTAEEIAAEGRSAEETGAAQRSTAAIRRKAGTGRAQSGKSII